MTAEYESDSRDEDMTPTSVTPTANDVQAMMRAQNWRFGVGMVVLIIISVITAYFAGGSRDASRDSFNAANAQYATQARSACITERRNAELHAIGDANAALGRALVLGLVQRDRDGALAQLDLFEQADGERVKAANSLLPDVLNDTPPAGCGPPILGPDDVPASTPTSVDAGDEAP